MKGQRKNINLKTDVMTRTLQKDNTAKARQNNKNVINLDLGESVTNNSLVNYNANNLR